VHLAQARREKPGEEKDDDGLGNLRGLKRKGAKADPAMRMVRVAEEEDDDEQQRGDGEGGIGESGGVGAGVVDAREHDRGEDAGDGPERLAGDEAIRGVVTLLCNDGGG